MMKFTKTHRYLWLFLPVNIKRRHTPNIACHKEINLAKQKTKKERQMKYELTRALGLNTNKPKKSKMEERQKRREGVSRRKEGRKKEGRKLCLLNQSDGPNILKRHEG